MENNQEADIFVLSDEDGNDVTVQALNYFYYNGKEYATVVELSEEEIAAGGANPDNLAEVFFMEVVPIPGDDENVEYVTVDDDDLADKLFEIISANYTENDGDNE